MSATATPPAAVAFRGIEQAFFDGDAIVVIDAANIYRFDASLMRTATLSREGMSVFQRGNDFSRAQDIQLVSELAVRFVDRSLQAKSACSLPAGFKTVTYNDPFFLLENADKAFAIVQTRTCERTDLPGFAKELEGSMGADASLISPKGTKIGIVRTFCDALDVYDARSMKKLRTDKDTKAAAAASAKGCDAVALTDEGKVSWSPRGKCAIGDPMTFIGPDVALISETDRIVIKKGVKHAMGCPTMGWDVDLPKKPVILGTIEKENLLIPTPRILDATDRHVLVANDSRLVLIKLAADKKDGGGADAGARITATESHELSLQSVYTQPVRPKPNP